MPKGSSIIVDYPDENSYIEKAGERAKKQAMLAGSKRENVGKLFLCRDGGLLSAYDFLVYEHLTPQEMTDQYFETYNKENPSDGMTAFDKVNYCLATRK